MPANAHTIRRGIPNPWYLTLLFASVTGLWLLGGETIIRGIYPSALSAEWYEIWKETLHLLFSTAFVYLLLAHANHTHRHYSQALQARMEDYRQFYEQVPVAYQSLDNDGNIREVNKQWERLTGYSRNEVLGRPMRELVAPEARTRFDRQLSRFLAGEAIHGDEMILTHRDGTPITVLVESRVHRPYGTGEDEDLTTRTYCALFDITRQRQAETALKESETRLAYALDNANDGVWDWQIPTGEVYFSPRWYTMLGFEPGEFPAQRDSWTSHIHPEDRPLADAALEAHLQGLSTEYTVDYRLRTRDGRWRWILCRGRVVERDTEGRPLRMIGTHVDIDRRKSLEQRLMASEQRYRLAAEAGRVAAWELWPEHDRLRADDTLFSLLGYRRDELGEDLRAWLDLIQAEHRPRLDTELTALKKEACNRIDIELPVRHKNGTPVWLYCKGRRTELENGSETRFLGVCIDTTHSKLTARALREEHRRAERYLEVAEVILLGLDRTGRIELLNRKGYEILGHPPGTLEGRDWFDIAIPSSEANKVRTVFDRLMQGREADHAYFENEILTHSGERRLIAWRNAVIRDEQGRVRGSFSSGADITDQRRAEMEQERLRRQLSQMQKQEALGRMTGGIAHDFNNILASILGYTSLALDRFGDQMPDKVQDYLREVRLAGERARDLVLQLLRFSRERAGTPICLDLAPLVKETVKMLEPTLTSGIRIEARLAPDTPSISIDPVQAHQVLVNLCINARDAMDGRGLIQIGLRQVDVVNQECVTCHQVLDGNWVELSVRDGGNGVAAENLERIFDPFYTTKQEDRNSGLGLAVTRSIVEQHGGHILVDSSPGGGSCFRLLFRAMEPTRKDGSEGKQPSPLRDASSLHISGNILVVDDEHSLTDYLADLLGSHGASVTTANDAKKALARFKEAPQHFDLVISDQTMPEMTGAELAESLLAIREDLPVILYSGYSETLDEQKARNLGIRHFFRKPVDSRLLLRTIGELLPGKQSREKS